MATCERKTGMVSGRSVIVVDTPGLFDRILAADAIKREFGKCVEMSMPGPHAFLLVIKLGRSPEEEKNALKWFQENFGPQALRYAIVLFTGGDRLKGRPVEDLLPRRADLRDSVHSCQNRYHVINNKEKIDRTQVTGLLEKIEAMVIHNRRTYYTNAMYQEARRRMREERKMQRQKYEMRIRQEEKKKEQKRATIQKEIKSAEKWKKCCSVLKDVGAFVEGGVEEEVCAAGLGNALGLLDYVVDDYEDDIKTLTKKLSKLK
ncbi:GTPase IMAP family member 7-like [Clupea harengus]|uniref:GTPase IMAP family member 7-like n=1 Tax=Clupea harengus TaxID=7950 RepID=A0A6P8F4V2_CLUHA|nr:GTPase IMAP family member 7-like [Clupea harengus]